MSTEAVEKSADPSMGIDTPEAKRARCSETKVAPGHMKKEIERQKKRKLVSKSRERIKCLRKYRETPTVRSPPPEGKKPKMSLIPRPLAPER